MQTLLMAIAHIAVGFSLLHADPEVLYARLFPEYVREGALRADVEACRPNAVVSPLTEILGRRTGPDSVVVVSDISPSDRAEYGRVYYFVDDILRAIVCGVPMKRREVIAELEREGLDAETLRALRRYVGEGGEPSALAREIQHDLQTHFAKGGEHRVCRVCRAWRVEVTVEIWEDTTNGLHVYFVATDEETSVIVLNPSYFGPAGFFNLAPCDTAKSRQWHRSRGYEGKPPLIDHLGPSGALLALEEE